MDSAKALRRALAKGKANLAVQLIAAGACFHLDVLSDDELRAGILLALGLNPWWRKESEEFLRAVDAARSTITPHGTGLLEHLVQVLSEDETPANRALAALSLGILCADLDSLPLGEAVGMHQDLVDRGMFALYRTSGNQYQSVELSLSQIPAFHERHSTDQDPRIVAALREALDDAGEVLLDPQWKHSPALDLALGLLMSNLQGRTIAKELRKGELGARTWITRYPVAAAAALGLILLNDETSAAAIVDMGERFGGGWEGYGYAGLYKLAYDIGWDEIADRLESQARQSAGHSSLTVEEICAGKSWNWAVDCLRALGIEPSDVLEVPGRDGLRKLSDADAAALGGVSTIVNRHATPEFAKSFIYIQPEIPSHLLTNALDGYAEGVVSEAVVVQVDTTIRGTGKSGLIVTPTRLYAHEPGNTWQVPLDEIYAVELRRRRLRINNNSIVLSGNRSANEAFLCMLRELAGGAATDEDRPMPHEAGDERSDDSP